eukprot:gnl/Spiro4/3857_TR1903_c0_g1_i1.p1 gnl/Spiro4/3857_TR1903_c0_g1~~gnl/Spiro4/3857_TR1903_c0_g1_i1.p1  ORF type:complete len:373 (+),score=93.63 gnl/Spiro4/3857_TR1903_c0_g1_i1:328-1446(+)
MQTKFQQRYQQLASKLGPLNYGDLTPPRPPVQPDPAPCSPVAIDIAAAIREADDDPAVAAARLLGSLPPAAALAQLFLTRVPAASLGEGAQAVRAQLPLSGGVVVPFADALIPSAAPSLRAFIESVQSRAVRCTGVPALVAVEFEGGLLNALPHLVSHFPSALSLGATNSPELIHRAGFALGSELAALGFNTLVGPVVDVAVAGVTNVVARTFGSTPELVERSATAFLKGLVRAGIVPIIKSFPGPYIVGKAVALDSVATNAAHYKTFASYGVPAVMVSHVNVLIDETNPTTFFPALLVPAVVTGALRDSLGFKKVTVSDYLDYISPWQAPARSVLQMASLALLAGCDMLSFSDPTRWRLRTSSRQQTCSAT